jgi:AcrR family transcriptional regulator
LFLERGYHNVAVADVSGSLGITASALYHHYRNKQDLLLYAALDGVDAVGARIAAATSLD